jgi:hypothetical protein
MCGQHATDAAVDPGNNACCQTCQAATAVAAVAAALPMLLLLLTESCRQLPARLPCLPIVGAAARVNLGHTQTQGNMVQLTAKTAP